MWRLLFNIQTINIRRMANVHCVSIDFGSFVWMPYTFDICMNLPMPNVYLLALLFDFINNNRCADIIKSFQVLTVTVDGWGLQVKMISLDHWIWKAEVNKSFLYCIKRRRKKRRQPINRLWWPHFYASNHCND